MISNHQSLFDIVIIGGQLFSNYPKYLAKRELGRGLPSISQRAESESPGV